MIIDIHGHLGNINMAPFWAADAARLEEFCAGAGIDFLCVSSALSLMYDVRKGNAELDAALRGSSRLLGYVVVSPVFPETEKDLSLLESNGKFRGVKVHPDYHGYDMASPRAISFLDRVAEKTPLMLFHVSCMPGTAFASAGKICEFAKRHPGTKFILAHLAGIFQNGIYPYFPNLSGLEEVARNGLENVYVDTAQFFMYVYPRVMEDMVEIIGPGRIVFGTDCPIQGPLQMEFAVKRIRTLDIPEEDKEKILCGNAKELLGI